MKVNMPNKNGYTAIGLAVHLQHKTCAEHMLKHPSAKRLFLDYYPANSESTVREIIMQTYPDLQILLKKCVKEDLDLSEGNRKLLAALRDGDYDTFKDNLDSDNPNTFYGEPDNSFLLEIACQEEEREQFVELLLDNGANPNIKNRVTGLPLIHATARSGNFKVLEILLEKCRINTRLKDNEEKKILHWLAGVAESKSYDKEKIENCLNILLESNYFRKEDIERSGPLREHCTLHCSGTRIPG
jgi:ankyrin repeat protein